MALFYPHYIHCQFGYLPGSLTTVFLPGAAMIYGAWAMNKIPNCWLVLKWGVVLVWLVVWNMAFIFPYIGNNNPYWLIFFRGVGQPPSSNVSVSWWFFLWFTSIVHRKNHDQASNFWGNVNFQTNSDRESPVGVVTITRVQASHWWLGG